MRSLMLERPRDRCPVAHFDTRRKLRQVTDGITLSVGIKQKVRYDDVLRVRVTCIDQRAQGLSVDAGASPAACSCKALCQCLLSSDAVRPWRFDSASAIRVTASRA